VVVKDDALLIDEVLAGDTSAFGELVVKYQDRLFNTLTYVVGSWEEAEDVVQEAFVQAFVKLSTFQRASAFYTWLYRIAFNLAVSRKRRRRPELSVDATREATGDEPVDEGQAPGDRLEQQESDEQVQAALERISEEHRAILVLREMEGFCYEKIAEVLDLPVGTVRSRLHRARMALREELEEVWHERCN
jgi:RNA polymerase sigma-70 factor (ECF subfamily)